jgi:sterol desaturase/sphingolipid hydroxylase (fatty acid hydroxylase superfamily)
VKLDPVTLATPFFIVFILIEMVWARRRRPSAYEPRDTLVSLLMGLGSVAAGMLAAAFTLTMLFAAYDARLTTLGWQWWAWIACFVLDDLTYYWIHRTGHRVRWFWASHVNHHSSQHYNLSTALRQSWTSFIALGFVFRLPLAVIGFHPAMILACAGINLVYQFWIHTEAINRFPRWFEAVMNTPSHHRVHHAINPQYLDRNYAGVFIVWDRLFGTFHREENGVQIHYGIVRQLGTFNVLWVAFHEWIGIAKDVWQAPFRHKLSYLWRVPGWTHDGSRQTSDMIRERWQADRE